MTPCAEFERRLALYAWDELEAADRATVEQHVAGCASCAAALASERSLFERLSSVMPEQPDDMLVAQCRRSLSQNLERASSGWLAARFQRWRHAFRPGAWLIAHPVWTVATLVLVGFYAGRIASQVPTVSVPAANVSEMAMIEPLADGVTPAALDGSSVTGIQRLPGGGVTISIRADQDMTVQGTPEDRAVRRALLSALRASDRPDPDARLESVELLSPIRTDQAVRTALCYAVLHDSNPSVRLKAIEALRGLEQEPDVRRTLLAALEHDSNPGVRVEAVSSLRSFLDASPTADWMHDDAVVRVLRERQAKDPNEFVRLQSDAAIRQISARNPQ